MKIKVLAGLILVCLFCQSQVSITSASFNEYNVTINGMSQIIISNLSNSGTAQIEIVLSNSANEAVLTASSNVINLNTGVNVFGNHNLKFSSINYVNNAQGNYVKNLHRLPSGNFNYCVRLNPLSGIEEGDDYCQSINTSEDDNLLLVYPNHEDEITSVTPLLMWMHTEAFNLLSQGEYFRLTLTEINEDQDASEAILVNTPIFVKNHVGSHQVQYPIDATALKPGKKYAWHVQKISNGNILASTETWSFHLSEQVNETSHVYVAMKKKLDGSVYYPVDDRIYFRFDERYQSNQVDCKIYSDSRDEVLPSLDNEQTKTEGAKSAGYNSYELDLKPYKLKKGFYTLEAYNEKKQKFQLKFYVD